MSGTTVASYVLGTPTLNGASLPTASATNAGGKGRGLLRLAPAWYPPTLIIPPQVHRGYREGSTARGFLQGVKGFQEQLDQLAEQTTNSVFVRSNASSETLRERGRFESRVVPALASSVEDAIVEMWTDLTDATVDLGFLIQPVLESKLHGHMSNEHRLCRDATMWRFEQDGWSDRSDPDRWRVTASRPADHGDLICQRPRDIEPVLRRVARWFSDLPTRNHIEWVWDGVRLWIVQADAVPLHVGPAPGDAWAPAVGREIAATDLRVWQDCSTLADDADLEEWTKASALSAFTKAGLPITQVWRLCGHDSIAALARGEEIDGFRADLQHICSGHVVVRTDIKGAESTVMLPKTPTASDPDFVERWLRDTSAKLLGEGVGAGDVSFLAHRFLRSRASAWALARPGDPLVEVDSIWGTPDGLAWLPHDSAWVNAATGEVRRSIEGKTSFLDIDEHESWTYRETPTEWIWRSSASEDQLRTIASGSRRLADMAGSPTLVMWFVGMLGGQSVDCIPWFRMQPQESGVPLEPSPVGPQRVRVKIRASEDLEAVLLGTSPSRSPVLRLLPGPSLVRDRDFLDRVIETASKTGATVELVGSALAHPYYVLMRAGVPVTCSGQLGQPEVLFNKLVRDGVVEHIAANGERVVSYEATGREQTRLLRLKLAEEAFELLRARDNEESIEEMADVLEVLDAFRRELGVPSKTLRQTQREKRENRGGFRKGSVLVSTGGSATYEHLGDQHALFDGPLAAPRAWQVQHSGSRIRLNCVPPLQGEPHVFQLEVGSVLVTIEYEGSVVEIGITSEADSRGSDSITLF